MDNIPHESLDRSPPDHLPHSCTIPHYHLQEIIWIMPTFHSLAMADLKGENGKYLGYAIATPFEVVEVVSLPMATWPNRLNYIRLVLSQG